MKPTVAIFGAGVAGLTAAHELASRGYRVTVYEAGSTVGGKARSQEVHLQAGGPAFPGEHGFRFFPAYYRHVPDSMSRIPKNPDTADPSQPFRDFGNKSILSNFVGVPLSAMARDGQPIRSWPRRMPVRGGQILEMLQFCFDGMDLTAADMVQLFRRMTTFYTCCDRRRLKEFEPSTWADFLGFDRLSPQAQKIMRAFPKCLVAMDAHQGSAFTIGNTSFLLLMDQLRASDDVDRVLNGPTSAAWLEPWRRWLERLSVQFRFGTPVRRFELDQAKKRIASAWIGDGTVKVEADYYIAALPIDRMQALLTPELCAACRQCSKASRINLRTALGWMVGAQFYLEADVPVVRGHVFYPDSPWALTSVSQAQFWEGTFSGRHGNGVVSGVLSVDISDWSRGAPGLPPASECTREQIREHLIQQINGVGRPPILEPGNIYGWHLDEGIEFGPEGTPVRNDSRLLIHPPGLLALRPSARTEIPNFMLASDYVWTNTDLATMEGASEAARRAVNAVIEREGDWPTCEIFDHLALTEPGYIVAAKKLDEARFDKGLPPFLFEQTASATSFEELQAAESSLHAALMAEKLLPS